MRNGGKGKVPGNNLKAKSAGGSMKSSLSGTMKKALSRKAMPSKGL